MKIPSITGIIDRRILINYQVEPEALKKFLPAQFSPIIMKGKGMAGICLIRLKEIRPKGLPAIISIASENAAHRIAVEWTEEGQVKKGVFIPRRDTSSRWNYLAGGRIFPGAHHLAKFAVEEKDDSYLVAFRSNDGTSLSIRAESTNEWSNESVFDKIESASEFFKNGAVGYCPDGGDKGFDGLELKTYSWEVTPLKVGEVRSSFFEDEKVFPKGSIKFDNALLMKNIRHEWNSLGRISIEDPGRSA